MKKLIFTLAISFITIVGANAQEIGQFWLGGSLGFWSDKDKNSESVVSFKLIPEIGYAINDNFGIGVSLGYSSHEYLDQYNEKEGYNTFTFSPFLRWAFLKGHFGGLFLDSGIAFEYGEPKHSDRKSYGIAAGFRPGVAVNVSHNVSITGKFGFIGYQYVKTDFGNDYDTYTNSFGIDLDMSQFLVGAIVKF